MIADTSNSPFAKLWGVPFQNVRWTDGLLAERFDTVANATVPHLERMFGDESVSHVVENFRIAAGEKEGDFHGTPFGDGDFYKWFEAALYTAVRHDDASLLQRLEAYIDLIARAQRPDGYLSTKQIIRERMGDDHARQQNVNDFEVYNMGHLFTAACLHYRLTKRRSFLDIAEKAASYLKALYDEAAKTGEVKTAVCPSHYMGLVELYRTTGKSSYLALAEQCVALRDAVKDGSDDNQDRLPLAEHQKIVGHAVRANYLYAGVTDLLLETGNPQYQTVLDKVWNHLITKKLYITGGCGALYNGASPYGDFFHHQLIHQAYGYEYQLPNITAYNETCASLGGVFWAWRRFLSAPCAATIDILERMMFNVNLAGFSLDGKKFFYENMLERAAHLDYELVWGQTRSEYILSYCCPPNLARTVAQSSEYAYAVDTDGIWTGIYGANEAQFTLRNGATFCLRQTTDYPYDGQITFSVTESNGQPFLFHFRVPGWAKNATYPLDGTDVSLSAGSYQTVAVIDPVNFCLTLNLGMTPRLTVGNPMIEETRNQACVECGPLVYCVESCDAPNVATLQSLYLPTDLQFSKKTVNIQGREITSYEATMLQQETFGDGETSLYRPLQDARFVPCPVRFIPYFAWDNRGMGEMKIWLPLVWREAFNT